MGRPRKIKSAKRLKELWEEYKEHCNNREVIAHDFSGKNSEFVSAKLKKCVTYTIEGFCVYVGIARQSFYEYYVHDSRYADIVTRMKEECEVDAREKFELGAIPSQLSALWMGKHGYSAKQDAAVEVSGSDGFLEALKGDVSDTFDGEDDVES